MTRWYEWVMIFVVIPVALLLLIKLLEYLNPIGQSLWHFQGDRKKRAKIVDRLASERHQLEQAEIKPPEVSACMNCGHSTYGTVIKENLTKYCSNCAKL